MIFNQKLNSITRIIVGIVFFVSAISKLISIDSFEIYIYGFGILKLNVAFFLARFIISLEIFFGVLLIVGIYIKKVILASIMMLSVFCAFILFLFLTENNEHCHCFGEIEISHELSLLKNILLVALLLMSYHSHNSKFKYHKYVLIILFICSILLPLIISPPDSLFYNEYSKRVTYNQFVFDEYLKENIQFGKGNIMLCFFSTGCQFCKLAAKKVSVMAKNVNEANDVSFVFANSHVSVDKFLRESNSTNFHYSFITPKRFLEITNGEMPLIIFLEDGNIKAKYGYRDINEYEFIKFMKN